MAKILVIDDDETIRHLTARILRARDHEVTEAADGALGMVEFRRSPTELVITDLIMPGQEGIATIIQLRREAPGVKIIAMSGGGRLDASEHLRVAEGLGSVIALAKPFGVTQLYEAVDKALAG